MQNLAGHCVLEVPGEPAGPEQTPFTISQHLWCSFLHTLPQPEKRMGETRPSPGSPAPMPEGRRASEPDSLPRRNMHVAPRWTQGRQAAHPPIPPHGSCLPRPPALPLAPLGLIPAPALASCPLAALPACCHSPGPDPSCGSTVSEPAAGPCSLTSAFRPSTSSPNYTYPPKSPVPPLFITLQFSLSSPASPAGQRGRHKLRGISAQAV